MELRIELAPVNKIIRNFQTNPSSIDYLADMKKLNSHQKEYLITMLFGKLYEQMNQLKWINENPKKHQEYVDFLTKINDIGTKRYI